MMDFVIKNGKIYDGSGEGIDANISVKNGKIE